jgi:diketogulonate reductase-like aldo/keto reductase
MNYKELAATEIQLPELALGTWRYQGGTESLLAGIELGATIIDTAESYGAEEIVGSAIKGIRHRIFLATKVSPRHFKREEVLRSAENSLRHLKTDYIDLYQLHWPNYTVPIAETMAAMEELVAMGKIRLIGVSNFSAREIEEAQASLSKGRIVSNQVRYSLVDRTIEDELLQYCESNRITVFAFSPLASGLENIRRYDHDDVLGATATKTGKTRAQVALNWCTSRAPVIAIFKADKVQHVRESCAASGWRLQTSDLDALNRIPFRRRGKLERFARRVARHCLQNFGRNV